MEFAFFDVHDLQAIKPHAEKKMCLPGRKKVCRYARGTQSLEWNQKYKESFLDADLAHGPRVHAAPTVTALDDASQWADTLVEGG